MNRRRPQVYMMDLLATVPYYTAYLSRALQQRGVDVRVGSITYYLDLECFRSRGLRLAPGFLDVVGRFRMLPRTVRRVAKLLETVLNLFVLAVRFLVKPPQILHVQYLPMLRSRLPVDWWFVRLLRWRGARVVLTVHDLLPHDTADRYRALFQRLYSGVDRMICHSSVVAERLANEFGVAPDLVSVIPHGPFFYDLQGGESVDAVRARYGIEPGQQMVLWQGIIFPYKGLDLLLEAWAEVEAHVSDATLLVVGTGSAEITTEVRAQVARLELKRVVLDLRFLSAEELTALYRAAAVVVYPYRAITTSGALATGVALGKAVVASDLPVFRELLTKGVDALLVAPGDAGALAAATLRLVQDATLRGRMEVAMQAKDFGAASWRSIAADTEAVYESVLQTD
ncbi:glycosyltransferase family 4 protein [Terriglobus sp.]|uniref:glycosyltransferase family 4 protein n=1 Tax=Terriglobus sp. TaxID=1889013 RepID=UPI003AFF903A